MKRKVSPDEQDHFALDDFNESLELSSDSEYDGDAPAYSGTSPDYTQYTDNDSEHSTEPMDQDLFLPNPRRPRVPNLTSYFSLFDLSPDQEAKIARAHATMCSVLQPPTPKKSSKQP